MAINEHHIQDTITIFRITLKLEGKFQLERHSKGGGVDVSGFLQRKISIVCREKLIFIRQSTR